MAQRRARQLVRWLGAAVWLYIVLGASSFARWRSKPWSSVLDAGISVGALSLTLGGVLAFAAHDHGGPARCATHQRRARGRRSIRALDLARGMPYALSTLVRYAVYMRCVPGRARRRRRELSQLSILLGGLGVGVGLGLQDFVKNFAAGLTLLFERRVHVGDAVQLPGQRDLRTRVEIGMRATVVRNWDGAEVVVPNSDLVSGAVTNWTLSDQLRRIELPVGVAYGTEPERVIELLLEVARGHGRCSRQPPPQALFQGFGESSLDFVLRVWFDMEYDSLLLRSELALATHREAGRGGNHDPLPAARPASRQRLTRGERRACGEGGRGAGSRKPRP